MPPWAMGPWCCIAPTMFPRIRGPLILAWPWAVGSRALEVMRHGKKIKVKCASGNFCRNCFNYWRTHMKDDIPQLSNFNDTVNSKPAIKKKWRKGREEYIIQKTGGKSRVRGPKKTIRKTQGIKDELEAPDTVFVRLDRYLEKYGDPKVTGAHVYDRMCPKTNRMISGVDVQTGEDGVFKVKKSHVSKLEFERKGNKMDAYGMDDGLAVHSDSVDKQFGRELAHVRAQSKGGALTEEETLKRKRNAESAAKAEMMQMKSEESDEGGAGEQSDCDSESDSGSEENDSSGSESGDSDAPKRKKTGAAAKASAKAEKGGKQQPAAPAKAAGSKAAKKSRKSAAPAGNGAASAAAAPSTCREMDSGEAKNAGAWMTKVNSEIEKFAEGQFAAMMPRQLQQRVRMLNTLVADCRKNIASLGSVKWPEALKSYQSAVTHLDAIREFHKEGPGSDLFVFIFFAGATPTNPQPIPENSVRLATVACTQTIRNSRQGPFKCPIAAPAKKKHSLREPNHLKGMVAEAAVLGCPCLLGEGAGDLQGQAG